ncbi:MAG TPA: hypothetical protein VI612_04310 [Candidatus Nanoarchaeia archaeon]|nr:hypothetical protein [Candidatus Nanoarchaeia archaeon]
MKKLWIVCALFILLVACAPAAEKPAEEVTKEVVKDDSVVGRKPPVRALPSENIDEGQTVQPSEPSVGPSAPVTTVTSQEMSPELRDLLKRADEKVSNLKYLFGGTDTSNLFTDGYAIKGTKLVIYEYEEDYYVREGYYDTVYVDTAAKTAVGCCIDKSRCLSHNVDNTGKKFDVDYASLNIPKTPYQWTKEVTSGSIVGPQTFNSRSVTYIKFMRDDGAEVQMWVDDTYGVPHKVVVIKDGQEKKYQFNDMTFNSLKDADFDAPCD